MTFQTLEYTLFLVALFGVYWLVGRARQNLLLLGASYFFYGFVDPWLAGLLAGFTVVNYIATTSQARHPERRTAFLYVSIIASLTLLGLFKYFNFFTDSGADALAAAGLPTFESSLDIVLPIGISFYTFQTLGYAIDIHQGRIKARTNLIDFALFVSFFPQLVAGPIERASHLLPQFERRRIFDPDIARGAIVLLTWGFFKKLVIADNVGVIADKVFSVDEPGFALLWVGVLAFGVQIFADFSGYTDIARGTARLFGFNLTNNFNHPFLARSPTDFWRRWHITLSTWFRDYVYIPLGGSRRGRARAAVNLLITFLLAGLWHGAAWNFVLWGAFHGVLVLSHRVGQRAVGAAVPGWVRASGITTVMAVGVTFVLMSVGWLLFREGDAGYILDGLRASPGAETAASLEVAAFLFLQVLIYSAPLWAHAVYSAIAASPQYGTRPYALAHATGGALVAAGFFFAILAMRSVDGADFIYFRF